MVLIFVVFAVSISLCILRFAINAFRTVSVGQFCFLTLIPLSKHNEILLMAFITSYSSYENLINIWNRMFLCGCFTKM